MKSNHENIQITLYNITLLRKKHGLSKAAMAKALGIGLYTLNKIETGQLPDL